MDELTPSYALPYVTLRSDYAELYRDVVEKVTTAERPWLSLYCANAPHSSIHAKLSITDSTQDARRADVTIDDSFAHQMNVEQLDGGGMVGRPMNARPVDSHISYVGTITGFESGHDFSTWWTASK